MFKYSNYLFYLLCIYTFSQSAQKEMHTHNTLYCEQEEFKRLTLLGKIYNQQSLAFIKNVTDLAGKTILDVDCGSGHMACEFAKQSAIVTTASIDMEQLEHAKQQAENQNIGTIEFIQQNIYNLAQLKKTFDIIYCRFVLIHVKEPEKALASLYACLKPQGILILEEAMGVQSITLNPYDQMFTDLVTDIGKIQSFISQSNLNYGSLLPKMLQDFNLKKLHMHQHHPQLKSPEEKSILTLIVKAISKLLLAHKATSQEYIDTMEDLVQSIQQNPASTIHYFKVMQIAAQKE